MKKYLKNQQFVIGNLKPPLSKTNAAICTVVSHCSLKASTKAHLKCQNYSGIILIHYLQNGTKSNKNLHICHIKYVFTSCNMSSLFVFVSVGPLTAFSVNCFAH